ncbi:hypothetical protein ARAM_001069 [Aspergillus rambellii]|uniref:Mediator of RNA polymerase II transcription subunit 8 n=1 Tax=Aspergillus rambellii TaxID=308745 RepID=A0A0F8V368_9EURO|nr:hypothetical protein ARAM_001069 [Aspergillus rambellii]
MSALSQDQIKTLDQSRHRLVQLTRSLGSLITSLNQSDPLPSCHAVLRGRVPAPEFPSRTQSSTSTSTSTSTLEQLLRTKLDPRVEDWVSRGRRADASETEERRKAQQQLQLGESELAALWRWAPVEANHEARRRNWGGDFTLEERERGVQVVAGELGLWRGLEDDESSDEEEEEEEEEEEDEDEDEDGEMEVVGVRKSASGSGLEYDIAAATAGSLHDRMVAPLVPLEEILRYMTTGVPPGQR